MSGILMAISFHYFLYWLVVYFSLWEDAYVFHYGILLQVG